MSDIRTIGDSDTQVHAGTLSQHAGMDASINAILVNKGITNEEQQPSTMNAHGDTPENEPPAEAAIQNPASLAVEGLREAVDPDRSLSSGMSIHTNVNA